MSLADLAPPSVAWAVGPREVLPTLCTVIQHSATQAPTLFSTAELTYFPPPTSEIWYPRTLPDPGLKVAPYEWVGEGAFLVLT